MLREIWGLALGLSGGLSVEQAVMLSTNSHSTVQVAHECVWTGNRPVPPVNKATEK
jgi:hypothetical protein